MIRRRVSLAFPVALALSGPAAAEGLEIQRNGARPSVQAPATNFTGKVRLDGSFQAQAPGRVGGATVTFDPGARTNWHTHPLGQTLIVVSGRGWVQREGDPPQEIQPGDIVWIPPGVRHWHGATATTAMSHVAIAEAQDGSPVRWMERVLDEQYPR